MNAVQVEQAQSEMDRGNRALARAILKNLLIHDPDNENAWVLYALVAKEREHAVYCLDRALRLNPKNETAQAWLATFNSQDNGLKPENSHLSPEQWEQPGVSEDQSRSADRRSFDEKLTAWFAELFEGLEGDQLAHAEHPKPKGWAWQCDLDGRYLACSNGVRDLLGLEPDNIVGKNLAFFHLMPRSQVEIAAVLRNGMIPADIPVTFVTDRGDALLGNIHISPLTDEKGEQQGWHGFTEVAERGVVTTEPKGAPINMQPTVPVGRERDAGTRQICPHLGLVEDPETCFTYPNSANFCFRPRGHHPIQTSFQMNYCLTDRHVDCPVYQTMAKEVTPAEKEAKNGRAANIFRHRTWIWYGVAILTGAVLVGLGALFLLVL